MLDSIVAEPNLNHETIWRYMCRLIERVHGLLDSESLVDDCLDVLVELSGADRGLILLTTPDGYSVVNARGQKKALELEEREDIGRTIVREVVETGQAVTWDPLKGALDSASFVRLGVVSAFAAPLRSRAAQGSLIGILYIDFRSRKRFVQEKHLEFFKAAATLLGTVVDQYKSSQTTRDHLEEARAHRVEVGRLPPLEELLAPPSMKGIARELSSAVSGQSPILILGESGTGKTLLAQAIADAGGRRPVVRAMLGSSDDLNTITSELFGHERGSFSGATGRRVGLVEYARGGTIILDEILNLAPRAQQLLLDFTQFGTYRPLGHTAKEPRRSQVRIIAATNGDLWAAIREGRFREDLYHRLAAVTLELPPLRARREDIPLLAEGALRRLDPGRAWTLSPALRELLVAPRLEWSGNVRQLERAVERARERALAGDARATMLDAQHLEYRDLGSVGQAEAASPLRPESSVGAWLRLQQERERLDELEVSTIREALARASGVVAHAARDLGVARTTLASRIEALAIRDSKRPR